MDTREIEKAYRVGLWRVKGVGTVTLMRLLSYFGSGKEVWEAEGKDWRDAGVGEKVVENFLGLKKQSDPLRAYEMLRQQEFGIYCLGVDEDYPVNLAGVEKPPMTLFARGRLRPEDGKALAIVGTRKPTSYGLGVTRVLVAGLVSRGYTVVSGLARGIDMEAHRTAWEQGGRTIGWLAGGIDRVYPVEHEGMVLKMVASGRGVVLSCFGPGEVSLPGNFAARNRYVAGLAWGVVVVEGAGKSGTKITSDFALAQGKPVFAVPGQINSVMSEAPLNLLRDGAKMVMGVEDIDGYFRELRVGNGAAEMQEVEIKLENELQERIYELLTREDMEVGELVRELQRGVVEVNVELTNLELAGVVKREGERYGV